MLLFSKIILHIHCSGQSVKLMPNFHRLLIYTSFFFLFLSFGKHNKLFIETQFFKKSFIEEIQLKGIWIMCPVPTKGRSYVCVDPHSCPAAMCRTAVVECVSFLS